jgi:DNA-binding CsgD family transcriptional regulator
MINDVVVWVRMASFTSLFVAMVLTVLSYQQRPHKWLYNYILFLSAHAVFDLVYTYAVIRRLYLTVDPSGSIAIGKGLIYIVLDTVATIIVLYFAPRFVLHALGIPRRRQTRLLFLPAVAVAAASVTAVAFSGSTVLIRGVAAVLYTYLAGWFAWGFIHRRRLPESLWRRWIVLFFGAAAVWHGFTAVEAVLLPVFLPTTPPVPLATVTSSLFNLFWTIIVVIPVVQQFRAPAAGIAMAEEGLPDSFVREYDLTSREAEIAREICSGAGTRGIGEKLFISPRTVDTHIQNIYRKCGVRRRTELIAMVQRYT